jgi:uroporphyrinogen III methyltransferase/synthase
MSPAKPGLVYLVGAGPGDPGLLTLRGLECLKKADVVIHDFLLNPILLTYAPSQAEIINAAQLPERHSKPLHQITRLMIEKARQGKTVVRLKGGDPLVYGRGGEEALALAEADVPFRIVPGVTSASAVPTYAGIPITQRGIASSLAVVAGHHIDSVEDLDWPRIAHSADTLVFLVNIQVLPSIVAHLLAEGRPPKTPIAVVERGTHPTQKTVVGTLADIAAQAAGLKPPAAIIVGEAVKLREKLRWFDRPDLYPLFGLRLLNTCPGDLSQRLEAEGAEVVEMHTTQVSAPSDSGPLDKALAQFAGSGPGDLPPYDGILFASAEAVRAWLNGLLAMGSDARALRGVKLGAVDQATLQALRAYGLAADFASLLSAEEMRRALLLHAEGDQPPAAMALRAKDVNVDAAVAYALRPATPLPAVLEMLTNGEIDAVLFFSPAAVRGLAHVLVDRPLTSLTIMCVGQDTAKAAQALGLPVKVAVPGEEEVVEALVKWRAQKTSCAPCKGG